MLAQTVAAMTPFGGALIRRFGARRLFLGSVPPAVLALAAMGFSDTVVGITFWRGFMAAFYAMYHGPEGLRRIAERTHRLTSILALVGIGLGAMATEDGALAGVRSALVSWTRSVRWSTGVDDLLGWPYEEVAVVTGIVLVVAVALEEAGLDVDPGLLGGHAGVGLGHLALGPHAPEIGDLEHLLGAPGAVADLLLLAPPVGLVDHRPGAGRSSFRGSEEELLALRNFGEKSYFELKGLTSGVFS